MENKTTHPLDINTSVYTREGKGFIKSCSIVNNFLFIYVIKSIDGTKEYEKLSQEVYVTQKELDEYLYIVGVDGKKDMVNHPAHYGGENNPFEAIKVIEHYDLGFHLASVIKYILRSDKKDSTIMDLEKAEWYIRRRIKILKEKNV